MHRNTTLAVPQQAFVQGNVVSGTLVQPSDLEPTLRKVQNERDEVLAANQRLIATIAHLRQTLDGSLDTHQDGAPPVAAVGAKDRFLRFVDDVTEKKDWRAEAETLRRGYLALRKSSEVEVGALQLNVTLLQQHNREMSERFCKAEELASKRQRDIELLRTALGERPRGQKLTEDQRFEAMFDDPASQGEPPSDKSVGSVLCLYEEIEAARSETSRLETELQEARRLATSRSDESSKLKVTLQSLSDCMKEKELQLQNITRERELLRNQVERLTHLSVELRDKNDEEEVMLLEARLKVSEEQYRNEQKIREATEARNHLLGEKCGSLEVALQRSRDAICDLEVQLDRRGALADEARIWESKCNNAKEDLRRALGELANAKQKSDAQLSQMSKKLRVFEMFFENSDSTLRAGVAAKAVIFPQLLESHRLRNSALLRLSEMERTVIEAKQEVEDVKAANASEVRRLTSDNANLRSLVRAKEAELRTAASELMLATQNEQVADELCAAKRTPPRKTTILLGVDDGRALSPSESPRRGRPIANDLTLAETPDADPSSLNCSSSLASSSPAPRSNGNVQQSQQQQSAEGASVPRAESKSAAFGPQKQQGKRKGFFSRFSPGPSLTERNAALDVEKAQLVVHEALAENMKLSNRVKELTAKLAKYERI